jgi:hypothetical protein
MQDRVGDGEGIRGEELRRGSQVIKASLEPSPLYALHHKLWGYPISVAQLLEATPSPSIGILTEVGTSGAGAAGDRRGKLDQVGLQRRETGMVVHSDVDRKTLTNCKP